tara:strand:- start:2134 stop:3591 length:1458 start_codon:yes stop_codon:yes gene_type:complete
MKSFGNIAKDSEIRAVASGALTNGASVIVNADNTVSVVAETSITQSVGSEVVFESATTEYIASTFDSSNNKVVVAYKDDGNSNYGTAVVGTVSGTSISFGSPVVFLSNQVRFLSAAFASNENKVVIAFRHDNSDGDPYAVVGTVSGTSISFGSVSAIVTDTMTAEPIACIFDSGTGKIVVAWTNSAVFNFGYAAVGTISGTDISFGTGVIFESGATRDISGTFDSTNGKAVIVFRDDADSDKGKAVVGTVSGTSISFGSAAEFESGDTRVTASTFDTDNGKVVIAYKDIDDSSKGKAVVGTVDGTSISFGSPVEFESGNTSSISISYNQAAAKTVIFYADGGDSSHGKFIEGTVSGTSISFGSAVTFNAADTEYIASAYDSNSKVNVVSFHDNGNSSHGTSAVVRSAYSQTNLTSENFVGFSDGAFADGQSAIINTTNRIDRNQSSLTAGQTLFVQNNGTLGLTAGDPSVTAGTAISATELIVKG